MCRVSLPLELIIIKVGNSNAGKTSLIKYYVDGEFTADYKPTVGKSKCFTYDSAPDCL
jgi:GTPase SAR1 family protein